MRRELAALLVLAALSTAHGGNVGAAGNCANTSTGLVPLTDLGTATYQGFEGGLYPDGENERPLHHTAVGLARAQLVVPRATDGTPDPVAGKKVFLSIGMSNAFQEFEVFLRQAETDPDRDPRTIVVNGAQGGQTAQRIAKPHAPYWDHVDQVLAGAGLSPEQVQVVWLKEANGFPTDPFPEHALAFQSDVEMVLWILEDRFPHLQLVYFSSRTYAGYAVTGLNPEPYAYEYGFAVKWLVEDQLEAGVELEGPWLSWGPYLWADGLAGRSIDDLVWACGDFVDDGTHPSPSGRQKVAQQMLDWVHTDATARAWYEPFGLP